MQPGTVGVLDVGCFSAHLVVVADQRITPVYERKVRLRLDKSYDAGALRPDGVEAIAGAVAALTKKARGLRIDRFVPFATSSVRDAVNGDEVIRQVARRTGVTLSTFTGRQEARLAYLAARRWFGWARGPLTVLDVGGGTVELAAGDADLASVAESLPYGARTLTALGLANHVDQVAALIRDALDEDDLVALRGGLGVGCSKVFGGLARMVGSRTVDLADLDRWIPRLARLSATRRAKVPGISRHRARQSLAGAVAARALMAVTGHPVVEISPWSTKEGLLLALMEQRSAAVLTEAA
ncbi:Ppx/GppA phosphatase family protein [Actinokineospora inagensis]|uniref:Ppx/GppA phosphatase family protein n=1 Tax=Actinokineospora inagensis TaxID=103730 RepID=UPI00047DD19B|nr:exopolyphosphatase [Actinokineospora inagensis]